MYKFGVKIAWKKSPVKMRASTAVEKGEGRGKGKE